VAVVDTCTAGIFRLIVVKYAILALKNRSTKN
jgi:hypothetical protein